MEVYVIKYRSYNDYENQGIESVFKDYYRAITHLYEDLGVKHLEDERYENNDFEFIITQEEIK